jgi:hypothetical protein
MRYVLSLAPSHSLARLVLVAFCAAAGLSCGSGSSDAPPPAQHELSGEPCEDPITAGLVPSAEVTEETGVARYDLSLSGAEFGVDLTDAADASLGRLETELELDISTSSGLLEEWRVNTRLVEGGETPAEQTLRGRDIGKGRLWLEIIHRAGDNELIQWAVVGEEREPQRLSIAVELDEGADPSAEGRVQMPDGRVLDVLEIIEDGGERLDQDEVDSWIDERLGTAFEDDDAWGRLVAVGDDLALWQGADAHVRLCQAASVDPTEDELTVRAQAQCRAASSAGGELRQRKQAQCSDVERIEEGLQWVLNVDSVMGAVGTGSAITGSLVAAGVITTGPVMGAVFVGTAIGSVLVGNAIDEFVSNNSDSVFDAAGALGGAAVGDRESGQAAANFFKGGSSGDPHFDSFDGVSFDYQGAGEFLFVEATAGSPFVVQVRQEPVSGNCPNVAINSAVATTIGQRRVAIYADQPNPLYIDGSPVQLAGGFMALPGGASIENVGGSTSRFEIRWPGGERLRVAVRSVLDLQVDLPPHRRGQMRGLLGNFNDDPSDDIKPRGQTPLEQPVDWTDLNYNFGASWRIDADDSLFDYFDGEDYSTFDNQSFPDRPTRLEDLSEPERQDAEDTCSDAGIDDEVAFKDCVLDVACTGDDSFVDSHTDRETESDLDMTYPIFLDGWIQQGDASNGNWDVSDDGRHVVQSTNGAPTFFVSPQDHHDTTIRGTFFVDGGDDDFIGFVFGFRAPLAENGDAESSFDTFLLSWKAREQTDSGNVANEGFTLSHLQGELPSSDYGQVMWGQEETAVHRVLDTRYADNLGWRPYTEYPFELTYTDDEIVIVIGGEEIFTIDAADSPAAFVPGRFGFYNYSQAQVHYGDFQSGEAEADPTASLAGLEMGVDRSGSNYEEFEMDTADPRLCRQACLDDARCEAFTFRRSTYGGDSPYCWLKDSVPDPIDDDGFISGVR